jgi:hypothetical protein
MISPSREKVLEAVKEEEYLVPSLATEDAVTDFNEWYEAELRSNVTKQPKKKSFSNSHLPATSQVSWPCGLNIDNNIPSTSAAYDSEHECCPCMITSSQQTNIQADHDQSTMQATQATMFIFMQAILVMLIPLSEFIYFNLNIKLPQQPSHAPLPSQVVTAVNHQSCQLVPLGSM